MSMCVSKTTYALKIIAPNRAKMVLPTGPTGKNSWKKLQRISVVRPGQDHNHLFRTGTAHGFKLKRWCINTDTREHSPRKGVENFNRMENKRKASA